MITIGKTKSVCPECMKVVPAIKGIGEDGIYLVKQCSWKISDPDLGRKCSRLSFLGKRKSLSRNACKSEG